MKKVRKRCASFVAGALALVMTVSLMPIQAYAETGDEIILNDETGIPDISLYSAMKLWGDENKDGILTVSEIESMTSLSVSSCQSLEGIDKCKNLTFLRITSTPVQDISVLSDLKNLEELQLSDTQTSNIDALKELPNLKILDMYGNQITDIGAVSNLTKLTDLYLSNNQISDISAVSSLINLKNLNFTDNQIINIEPISNLVNLTSLWLSDNQISKIDALKNLKQVTWLCADKNRVYDISALSGFDYFERLVLEDNHIMDISALSGLQPTGRVTIMYLAGNHITDFSCLEGKGFHLNGTSAEEQKEIEADCPSKNLVSDDVNDKNPSGDVNNTPSDDTTNGTTPKDDVTTDTSAPANTVTSKGDKNITVTGAGTVLPTGATFMTKQLTEGEEHDNVASVVTSNLGKDALYSVYKMDLNDANGNAMTQLSGSVKVSLPIPTTLNVPAGKTVVVYRCEDNGTLTKCSTTVKDGMVTFETNHFSYYVMAVVDKEEDTTGDSIEGSTENGTENNTADATIYYLASQNTDSAASVKSPKTADASNMIPAMLMVVSMIGIVMAFKKTKRIF